MNQLLAQKEIHEHPMISHLSTTVITLWWTNIAIENGHL